MTTRLYETDMQASHCSAVVKAIRDTGAIILDQTVFYAQGGGQPGDVGTLSWDEGKLSINNTVKGEGNDILHFIPEGQNIPAVGTKVEVTLDWERRQKLMRMHTALHLLCQVVGAPVTGGSIGKEKGRLDFDLTDSPDKDFIQKGLEEAISANYPVTLEQITDTELDANPDLVKTMSVQPPRNNGVIRMVRIGYHDEPAFDYQPCGGTHVSHTGLIGSLTLGKVEKKGRQNRRINVHLG